MREKCNHSAYTDLCDDCKQANELARLRAEVERLRALCADAAGDCWAYDDGVMAIGGRFAERLAAAGRGERK